LQVILIAKEQTDDGWISFKNVSNFAQELGGDRTSIEGWIVRESTENRITIEEKSKKLLRFYLANYNTSQSVTRFSDMKNASVTKLKGTKLNGNEIKDYPATPDSDKSPTKKDKKTDKAYPFKWEYVNARFAQIIGRDAPANIIGLILSWGQDIGETIVAIHKIQTWTTEKQFVGAIRDTLRDRGKWSDENREMVKLENSRFDNWLGQRGMSIGDIVKKL
jgi:hypothetical protein